MSPGTNMPEQHIIYVFSLHQEGNCWFQILHNFFLPNHILKAVYYIPILRYLVIYGPW